MCEEMRRDENVYFVGEDIGLYCGAFGVSKGIAVCADAETGALSGNLYI